MMNLLSINPILVENLFGSGIDIHWYGVMIALGVLGGIIAATLICRKRKIHTDIPIDLAVICVLVALVFARLYYVVFDTTGTFVRDPLSILYVWEGGLAIYGGIIGAVLALFVYSRHKKISMPFLMDLAAPSLALGQAFGRWGNFINQEAFGGPVTNPAWQRFPFAVFIEQPNVTGYTEPGWFHATFFYESMWCLLIFVFLFTYVMRGKQKFNGEIVIWYFTLYGIERAGVELLRTDQLWIPGTQIPVSHVVSLVLFAVGVFLLIRAYRRLKKGIIPPYAEVLPVLVGQATLAYPPDEKKPAKRKAAPKDSGTADGEE